MLACIEMAIELYELLLLNVIEVIIINQTGAMETRQVSVIFSVIYLCTNKNAHKSFN